MTENPESDSAGRKKKRHAEINVETCTVTFDGISYSTKLLPAAAVTHFALLGIWGYLRSKANPEGEFYALIGGKTIGRSAAPAPLDPWREAAAWAHAEAQAKGGAIPRVRGVSLVDRPEFQRLLADARETARGWKREQLDQAKTHPTVVAHYNRLTGKTDELAALFGTAAAPPAADPEPSDEPEPETEPAPAPELPPVD